MSKKKISKTFKTIKELLAAKPKIDEETVKAAIVMLDSRLKKIEKELANQVFDPRYNVIRHKPT